MAAPRRTGFTLVETIASIVIVAVALPPMLWAIRDAHAQRVNAVLASRARWLATEKLEDVIADRHSTTRGYAYLVPGNYAAESPVATDPDFDRTVSLSETEADLTTTGDGYMNVTVTVSWTDAGGDARSLDVRTVLTEYSP
jgi:prepilin-type N-terminal cleavage/methylation domain-containing protein